MRAELLETGRERFSVLAEIRSLIAAGTLMGVGFGGLFEGIFFRQILALHGMVSNRIQRATAAGMEINGFLDGVFNACCLVVVITALGMLWRVLAPRRAIPSGRIYFGSLWAGWGLFNVMEGLLDHQILQLHHVYQRDSDQFMLWDTVYLACGVLFLLIGWGLVRSTPAYRNPQYTDLRYDEIP